MVNPKNPIDDKTPDESLGMYLVRVRKAAGLTREDLSQTTRIPIEFLAEIEESDWKKFPVEAYVRSYINSICSSLELDNKKILGWFSAEYGSSYSTDFMPVAGAADMKSMKKLREPVESSGASKAVPIIVIVLGIAFLAVMNFMKRSEDENVTIPPAAADSSAVAVDSALVPDSSMIPEGAESIADSVSEDSLSEKAASSISEKNSSATTFITSSPSREKETESAEPGTSGTTRLILTGNGRAVSWVGAKKHAADSTFIKEVNLSSVNSRLDVSYDDTLFVVIGNPAGIGKMTLNGVETALPVRNDGRATRLCILNGKLIRE